MTKKYKQKQHCPVGLKAVIDSARIKSNRWFWVTPTVVLAISFVVWLVVNYNQVVAKLLQELLKQPLLIIQDVVIVPISAITLLFATSLYLYIDYQQHLLPLKQGFIFVRYRPLHHMRVVVLPRMKYNWRRGVFTFIYGIFTMFVISFALTTGLYPQTAQAYTPDEFVTTWKTDNPGISSTNQIIIPTTGLGYNYIVNWQEVGNEGNSGSSGTLDDTNTPHTITFPSSGTYEIRISGIFPRIYFNNGGDSQKLLTVEQWGTNQWDSMLFAFAGASNLNITASDTPDLSNVQSMSGMFMNATSFNSNINNWDVSEVVVMSAVFNGATSFNQPLNNWDTSSATSIGYLFADATSFNQPLNNWDVSSVTNMSSVFNGATSFNQPLNNWDTSSTTNMLAMFAGATSFDQSLADWNVESVNNFQFMFLVSELAGYQPSGISTDNYDETLVNWSQQSLQTGVIFNAGLSTYCLATQARQVMIDNFSWTITDSGESCDESNQLQILTTTLPVATKGEEYSATIYTANALDNDAEFNIISGSLPDGLRIDDLGDYARISGISTVSGEFNLIVRAQDANNYDTQTYSLSVKDSMSTVDLDNQIEVAGPIISTMPTDLNQNNNQKISNKEDPQQFSDRSTPQVKSSPSILEQNIEKVSNWLGITPQALIWAFPWSLIMALALLVLSMILRAVGQWFVIKRTQKLVERQELLNHEKRSLLSLSGHYLRTPLTILSAGIEMLPEESNARQSITVASQKLQQTTSALITAIEGNQDLAQLSEPEPQLRNSTRIIQKAVILPIFTALGLIVSINLVVAIYTSLNPGLINVIAQLAGVVLFGVLLHSSYQLWQQRRSLAEYERQLLGYEETLDSTRNKFIRGVSEVLMPAIVAVDAAVPVGLPDDATKYFKEGLRQLEHTIENFILIGQLEKKQLRQKASEVSIKETFARLEQAEVNHHLLSLKVSNDVSVKQPEFLLRKVFGSLVDNAAQHSDSHQPIFVGSQKIGKNISVSVEDKGEGIADDKLSMLFKPLSRVEEAEDFTHQGLGLSLYVDRLIMHYLGGEISAHSQLGSGTIMKLSIPNELTG